jgi:hypothetical protein
MRKLTPTVCALGGLLVALAVRAQDAAPEPPGPDLDFLEYLGTWQAEDDEWLAVEEWQRDDAEDAPPPADQGTEKARERQRTKDDESE